MALVSTPVSLRERVGWIDALRGFALLLFRSRSDRTLIRWAIGLLVSPVVIYGVLVLVRFSPGAGGPGLALDAAEILRRMTAGSLRDYLAMNAFGLIFRWLDLLTSLRRAKVIGMFLLGLWAGRRTLHARLDASASY
jgi:uncharacterized protein